MLSTAFAENFKFSPAVSIRYVIFSITPTTRCFVCKPIAPVPVALLRLLFESEFTTNNSLCGSNWAIEIAMSPVPGEAKSISNTSMSPQKHHLGTVVKLYVTLVRQTTA